jgi:hypothetical protein
VNCEKLCVGASGKCTAHGGGGQRCNEIGCRKLSLGASGKCKGHGGSQHYDGPGLGGPGLGGSVAGVTDVYAEGSSFTAV